MFVYENKNHEICVVFDGVVPAETPDYVLRLDRAEKKLYVNGKAIDAQVADDTEPVNEPVAPAAEDVPAETPDEDEVDA